uniref:Methyltransferase n=1 Tax=Fusarium oxysporum (strain Fo5176) TaxID=660025 RepID=A0A0D2XYS7_FUSOF
MAEENNSQPAQAVTDVSGLLPPEHWAEVAETLWCGINENRGTNDEKQNESMDIKDSDIEDCTQEWTFAPNSQDYIHFRWLVGSIVDWDQLFKEAYRCLKPGGYIESHEALSRMDCDDGTITEKSAMHQWGKFFVEGGKKIGRSFTIVEDGVQRSAMEKAGFVNLVERDFKVPIGGWPKDPKMKEIGKYAQATLEQDIEGYVLFMANTVEGWTKEEVEVYISMLRRELRQGNMHPYYWQKVVWAQKPKE